MLGNTAEDNISVVLTLNADFRILAPPLEVRQGGADLSGATPAGPNYDKDERTRSTPASPFWSIGAYEYD